MTPSRLGAWRRVTAVVPGMYPHAPKRNTALAFWYALALSLLLTLAVELLAFVF